MPRSAPPRGKPAPAPRAATKAPTGKTRTKPGAAGVNHKTPEAQAARDKLDQDVGGLLTQKRHAEGLGKVKIAELLKADANAVKASCNRLGRAGVLTSSGTTMNTVYKATKDGATKLAALRPAPKRRSPAPSAPPSDDDDEAGD